MNNFMNSEIKRLVSKRPREFWYRIELAKPKKVNKEKPKAYIKNMK